MTAEHISSPPIPPMNFPWNHIPNPDQLAADQDGLDDNLPRYSTQLESVSTSTSISQSLAMSPPQIAYSYSTTTMLPSVPNHGSQWNNTPNSIQYYNTALEGVTSIGYSSSPVTGSGCSSPSTSQMAYPNGHSSWSTTPSQYTAVNHTPLPSIFDHNMSTSDFSPYNTLPYQWQTHTVLRPGHLSLPFTPMMPPPLAVESSRVIQPHASHGEQIGYALSPLLSCRWLNDDAVTHCEFIGTLEELKTHCKAIHFTGPTVVKIECRWEGCDYYKRNDPTVRVMRRDTIWRHIYETHLRLKRGSI
ncbi:hypothetical protein DFJ58DRAFT_750677 [Suillus subalutaceus]|uniref:uncharacterized protein n=1 Tax=Suillus subalutaceus TaxID=48586 RepID=UPI001B885DA1|nr:uncharacterized protein DFJ58DRAFT_750677 [Suillus subalutaceus]KAG1829541.1 hypothetical protein DFJ58DRAFT_750677 [Suillus subalutaceus]